MLRRMPADHLAEELRLARRELRLARAEQERLAERLMRTRRQRARLRKQVKVISKALARELSASYWRSDDAPREERELVREVEASPSFDAARYLRDNLEAARRRVSPAAHHVRAGGR